MKTKLVLLSACTTAAILTAAYAGKDKHQGLFFHRIATFPVFLNTGIDQETVAEIVTASKDGKTLIYTDGTTGNLGFVDITDPASPQPGGVVRSAASRPQWPRPVTMH